MEPGVLAHALQCNEWRQLALRLLQLRLGTRAIGFHAAQHITETFSRAVWIALRVEIVRPLRKTREHRAFSKRKFLRRFSEIAARSHFDAPRATAEINRIQIQFENFALG